MTTHPELVWYVSYGSNMCADRLTCYLAGGTPPGAQRVYSGCRDRRPPRRAIGCHIAGQVYFATESPVWGGGRAFYDPELAGTAAARAYLITAGQFADIAAQEMYGQAGADIDLEPVLATGRAELGPGRYETLMHIGDLDGHPLLTFTAPWHAGDVPWTVPSASYLRMLAAGLREAHGWDAHRVADYLAHLRGAHGHWTPAAIAAL
ncbi:MAG TPA: histone deacetylase [Pseudonocardiaceae bacterium]